MHSTLSLKLADAVRALGIRAKLRVVEALALFTELTGSVSR
jgi:hypothetical protein